MKDLAIVVFSCDKNNELWDPFNILLNKYWPTHPQVYLLTETKKYDNFISINENYDISLWSKRIRKSLKRIPYKKILFICDDCFLRAQVNESMIKEFLPILKGNNVNINMELSWDNNDKFTKYPNIKKRTKKSEYEISLLCGLWQRKKLIKLLSKKNCSNWEIEKNQNNKWNNYYICSSPAIQWFNDYTYAGGAISKGQWTKDAIDFFKKEKIDINFKKKGFHDFWWYKKF